MLVYYGEIFHEHKPPGSHHESPERLNIAVAGLKKYGVWDKLRPVEPPPGSRDLALKIHDRSFVDLVEKLAKGGGGWLDSDTYVSRGTWPAALAALGSAGSAATKLASSGGYAVLLERPPGHHSGRNGPAMGALTLGFCIFNVSALAAIELAEKGYRVGVLDFDLHHGNGTQEILYEEEIYHVDLHQDPWTIYPGTGLPEDVGGGPGLGTKYNIVLAPGSGDDVYAEALEYAINVLNEAGVNALVVDMGFDAYLGDGLAATMSATSKTYHRAGEMIRDLLKPRVVLGVLEGGYTLGLERGLPAFTAGLLGEADPVGDEKTSSPASKLEFLKENIRRLEEAIKRQA